MRSRGNNSELTRRRFLRGFGITALLTGIVGVTAVRGTYKFVVSHHRRVVSGLRSPVRLSFLTDLHLGPYLGKGSLDAWCAASNAASPDLVVLGGDLVDRFYRGDLRELVEGLQGLTSRLGIVAVPGNHDRARYPDLSPLRGALEESGVVCLINDGIRVRDDLSVAGVDDLRKGDADPVRAMTGVDGHDGARILLSHNPDILPALRTGDFPGQPPDLVLCGHTHGGQVKLPLVGPLVTSSAYGTRFAEGWVENDPPAFVSRGLGVSLLPVRWNCAPEVVVLDLLPPGTVSEI